MQMDDDHGWGLARRLRVLPTHSAPPTDAPLANHGVFMDCCVRRKGSVQLVAIHAGGYAADANIRVWVRQGGCCIPPAPTPYREGKWRSEWVLVGAGVAKQAGGWDKLSDSKGGNGSRVPLSFGMSRDPKSLCVEGEEILGM